MNYRIRWFLEDLWYRCKICLSILGLIIFVIGFIVVPPYILNCIDYKQSKELFNSNKEYLVYTSSNDKYIQYLLNNYEKNGYELLSIKASGRYSSKTLIFKKIKE